MIVLARIRDQYFRLKELDEQEKFLDATAPLEEINIRSLLVDNQCNGGWNFGIYGVLSLRPADPDDQLEQWMDGAQIAELSYYRPCREDIPGFDLVQVRPTNPLPDANNHL